MRNAPCSIDHVESADGTRIGFRKYGAGPAVILIHGGLQTSQSFAQLATHLSARFSVYVPDRRGRGMSGPFGADYTIDKERDDLAALLRRTGAQRVFGLSSGALIALQSALALPEIQQLALYEPPLPFDTAFLGWADRYERELARADLAAAFVTAIKATADGPFVRLPRWLLVPLLRLAMRADAKKTTAGHVPLQALIPTMHYDLLLVASMTDKLAALRATSARVLLLGGSASQPYLRAALDSLRALLPAAEFVEFTGVGHIAADNNGKPELVARALGKFF